MGIPLRLFKELGNLQVVIEGWKEPTIITKEAGIMYY